MKQARVLGICSLSLMLALCGASYAAGPAGEFKLGTGSGKPGDSITIGLQLITAGQEVQGFVAAADLDNGQLPAGKLEVLNLTRSALVEGADQKVSRVGFDTATKKAFFVLGAVMNTGSDATNVIPPGTNELATITVKWTLGTGDVLPDSFAEKTIPFAFTPTATYSAASLGPKLDNIIVIGGQSFGVADTVPLAVTAGAVTLKAPAPGTLTIKSYKGVYGDVAAVPVELDCASPVQGFQVSIQNDAGLTLTAVDAGPAVVAQNPEFTDLTTGADGGIFAVVLNLGGSTQEKAIPAGKNVIATFKYATPVKGKEACEQPDSVYGLRFVDFAYGDPVKENLIVIGGYSKNPDRVDSTSPPDQVTGAFGTVTLKVDPALCGGVVPEYALGGCDLGVNGKPAPITVQRGAPGKPTIFGLGLWYRSPEDGKTDEADQGDHIQGLSMAVAFPTQCMKCVEGSYSLVGTITEAVKAEFVNVLCENNAADGDDGELVVGILVDALPPFDGTKELPPTDQYLKVICVDFAVNQDGGCVACEHPSVTFPEFPEGVDIENAQGQSTPLIRNLVTVRMLRRDANGHVVYDQDGTPMIDQVSVLPKLFDTDNVPGLITISNEPQFVRGDCNMHDGTYGAADDAHNQVAVDISDAAAIISFLFYEGTWKFDPPCMDACDANDDGRVDLADSVVILRYLFKYDGAPAQPFPQPGPDTTYDHLPACGGVNNCQ